MNRVRLIVLAAVVGMLLGGTLLAGPWLAPRARAGRLSAAPIIQLTNNPAADLRPMWSPDYRQIAFQSNRDGPSHLYLMSVDGSNQRALTKGKTEDRHPVWMPDGKQIVFDSADGGKSEIWLANVADGSLRQVTKLGALASFPSPSPDGKRIAFYLFKDQGMDIWTVNLDGSDTKQITKALATAQNEQCTFACHHVGWSPDGKSVAYPGGSRRSIWVTGADGGNAREFAGETEINHFPWFLEDGRLAYIAEHVESTIAWTDAWAVDLKSGEKTMLQDYMALQGPMEWNRELSRVLFHSPRSGNFDIYLIDLSVPGGAEVLQGTPVPGAAKPGPAAPAPAATGAPAAANASAGSGESPQLAVIAAGVMAVVVLGGILLWWVDRRRRRSF